MNQRRVKPESAPCTSSSVPDHDRVCEMLTVSTSFNGIQRSFRSPLDSCTREVTFHKYTYGFWLSLQLEVSVVPLCLPCFSQRFSCLVCSETLLMVLQKLFQPLTLVCLTARLYSAGPHDIIPSALAHPGVRQCSISFWCFFKACSTHWSSMCFYSALFFLDSLK